MNILGIDLGGTNTKLGIVDQKGAMVYSATIPTDPEPKKWITRIEDEIDKTGLSFDSIGLGCPGTLDFEMGMILETPNLKSFQKISLTDSFSKHFKKSCWIENDANCAALGELYFGSMKSCRNFAVLTLGTGVGGGVVCGGQLVRGHRGFGAELGHMSITAGLGPHCHCGRQGCLESYVGGLNISERYASLSGKMPSPQFIFEHMESDLIAKQLVAEWIMALAHAIDNIRLTFDPEWILFSGGLSRAWSRVESGVKTRLSSLPSQEHLQSIKVGPSGLGPLFGVWGAAALVLEKTSVKNGSRGMSSVRK